LTLLGTAVLLAQKLEFALYGIVAHFSYLPEAQREKRFRELKPEAFLRGDPSDLKATLGQLVASFEKSLRLASNELDRLVKDRSLIAHNSVVDGSSRARKSSPPGLRRCGGGG
jgi:hypothetical protein